MLEVLAAMEEKNMRTVLVGDLNVDRNETPQDSEERSRWNTLCGELEARGLAPRDLNVNFTSKSKQPHESDSYMEYVFMDSRPSNPAEASLEDAPGDHCWLHWGFQFRSKRVCFERRKWYCDWNAYCGFCKVICPETFSCWQSAEHKSFQRFCQLGAHDPE